MNEDKVEEVSVWGTIGAFWGIIGLSWLFSSALVRLYPYACKVKDSSFAWYHWVGLVVCLIFMGYAEGYKGFQLRFSPRAAARALYLKRNPSLVRVLFAPLFCMGYFHATRKRKIVAYSLTTGIIGLIILVHHTPQPWHGIIDVGVIFGLGWGMVSVWVFAAKALFGSNYEVSPETPEG